MPYDQVAGEVNPELLKEGIAESNASLDLHKKEEEAAALTQEKEKETEAQALLEQKDPRNKEKWGLGGVAKELQSVVTGGLQDTASSVVTFPERTLDMLNGEMQREGAEYRPDWDPFTDYDNPIETKTWWGKLLRGTVHFGSLALVPIAGQRALGFKIANSFVRAAGIGAVSDLISKESDGHNALGAMRDAYGFVDTPLSTKEGDHPIMMKVKNILEGMGIGAAFDGASILLGKGSKRVVNSVQARNKSIADQTIEKGLQELRDGHKDFRGAKNKPIAKKHQAAYTSQEPTYDARQKLVRTRKDYGAEEGSTGSVTTPKQREIAAGNPEYTEQMARGILKDLKSSQAFQADELAIREGRTTWLDTYGDAVGFHQRTVLGRNAADMPTAEYLQEFLRGQNVFKKVDPKTGEIFETNIMSRDQLIASDLLQGTLLKQLRDTGIAGRELADIANLGDIDGPAQQILDTMLTLLAETKRSKLAMSDVFTGLSPAKAKKVLKEALDEDMAASRESITSVIKLAGRSEDDNLLKALFETFSSMENMNNLDDFDSWARKMIRGGNIEGRQVNGAMIRELQGMFIHSILSGPKTAMRAMMGTSTATFIRPFSTAIGATMRYPFTGDSSTIRSSLASMNAMMEAIPESFALFKNKFSSYWSGETSTVKTRFSEYTKGDENWEILRQFAESDRATVGDKASFYLANMARAANDVGLFTYSTKLMAATDDSFSYILGRAKMREKAMRSAMDAQSAGKSVDITPDLIRKYEDDFYSQVFDADGNIKDDAVNFAAKEVKLTKDLTGFAAGMERVFNDTPWAKPFFLFAKTGVNGIELTAKHTPGFNFLVKEFNEIAWANPDNLDDVLKYGITSPEELANAKALQTGRLAIGSGMISMAAWSWMNGNLTGNGPTDRQQRQVWMDGGYKPRSMKVGGVWVGYDSIEPFNQIFSIIADVGDHSELMGEEWTEKQLQSTALVMAQGIASKSYLAGMQQFVDFFAGKPGQGERIVANIMNNQIPLAGLRNELGKLFTPYTRELGSGIDQAIRNRNLAFEKLPGADLPIKYDMLNGRPIKDHDFMTRMFNMVSPVQLSLDQGPGRKFLFDSGYDLRQSTYYSPDGVDLSDSPEIRSLFQKAIGDQNLERQLDKLAADPRMQASLDEMNQMIKSGRRGDFEYIDFPHNRKLRQIFNRARKRAWASIINNPQVQKIIQEQKEADKVRYGTKRKGLNDYEPILNMYK
jgi:hypothetical protein